jgi:hypothetical protein
MDSRAKSWTARITFIALIISLVPLSAFSAQKVTAGAACKTLNSKATANNKTYTCIKSGKKLVWNKGIPIKTASPSLTPKPSPVLGPSTSSTSGIDELSRDPRISNISLLSPSESCKTVDATPDNTRAGVVHRNGFPRPADALYPSGKAKLLVIPFQYSIYPFMTSVPPLSNRTMSDIQELKKANDEVEEYVKKLSAGRFEIDIEILPEKDWWVMDPALAFSGEPFFNNFPPVLEMIEKNDGKIDFEKYDSYVFVVSRFGPIPSIGTATHRTELKTSKGQANKLVLMSQTWANVPVYFHELGHSMFAFEDLYLMSESPAEWLPQELKVIMSWDLMADASLNTLTNWNRYLMGWVTDKEVRCLTDQSQSTHYLSDFTSSDQPKLLLINLAPGVTLAAESRPWGNTHRLLLYVIDTNLNHGQGPLRALNTLIPEGETKELFDWKFNVLKSSKDGLLLEVSKGSGKKYVAPARPQTNQGGGDRPRPRIGEALPTTYLNARIRWEVTNYKSYRIFITPFDDPKKILFDTGIVNDSRDPLIVEASGLICGKELVTTSQFWTERDGKGVKEQSSSGQLGKFQCK